MSEAELIHALTQHPETVTFNEVMAVVQKNYSYRPVHFSNGVGGSAVQNPPGKNEGACRIFAWAKRMQLSESQTLHCFGDYYRQDVLNNPESSDHANIRSFIKSGWAGIHFTAEPLERRAEKNQPGI